MAATPPDATPPDATPPDATPPDADSHPHGERIACVDIPALPLQRLLLRHRDWRGLPAAVVDQDKPQGVLLWVNEAARRNRILPGLRYAAALSLDPTLRAGVVSADDIASSVETLTERLWRFSPLVEARPEEPGVFWLDGTGLLPLYRSYQDWALRIRQEILAAGYITAVAVGFSRFATYATARAQRHIVVFDTRAQEIAHCREAPIERLGFPPKVRDRLAELGIHQLGQFLDLPASGLRRRFGKEAYDLYCRARGDTGADTGTKPLQPLEPLTRKLILDRPEADLGRILAAITDLLTPLLHALRKRHQVLASIRLDLTLDDGSHAQHTLQPAEPTLDGEQIAGLINLRLQQETLSAGAMEVDVTVAGTTITLHQRDLFQQPKRDLAAARRALARLRAEFGDASVVRAHLQNGHLPEAQFGLEPLHQLAAPRPTQSLERPLVRRFFPRPTPLPFRSRNEPDGWHITTVDGPVEEVVGPHLLSGAWWIREVSRDYYYIRTRSGRWLWVYHDRRRRRWLMQGEVE